MEIDRDDFGARQAEMTARWFENVKATHGDVDAYIATRWAAYLDRWREAARFIADGARVLDVGGGNLFPPLVEFLRERGFRYAYLDVDPLCVEGSRNLARSLGLEGAVFEHGYNDALPFPDASFDAIFSSHCIEHSIDLARTFAELNRVLAPGGNLLMAVPFGWEDNPEHPYFLAPEDWISLVTDAGFAIRVAQVGCEYPELGYDYFIAARKVSPPKLSRLDPADYRKTRYRFVPWNDPAITCHGAKAEQGDHVILLDDWRVEITVPDTAREILAVTHCHEWSGTIELASGDTRVIQDLSSWFPYVRPVRLTLPQAPSRVTIRCRGRNPSSHASQCVLSGVMIREAGAAGA